MPSQPNWFSESLARGLTVIRAFGHEAARLRITEVSERTGLTRAAARRFLFTLRELGYLASEGDYFFLRPRVLDLGYAYISAARIEVHVEPILKDLADKTRTSAHFAVLDDDSTLFVASIYDEKMHGFFIAVGARRPAYAGSLGKCLLSGLSPEAFEEFLTRVERTQRTPTTLVSAQSLEREVAKVRKQGYAINNGEFISGVVGIAVPVRDREGRVAAAININWFSPKPIAKPDLDQHLPSLLAAAREIEARLIVGGMRPGFDTPGRG
ncbi:IclR family transcriptional regulator C-terminal domain-containing protein [Methylocapsa sp. S129]|uniref:IclR family transcriptional regulator domain-containing protein n=1 Tax=Methylocapsa sp. S129 TaxID=1641869 RepID=UPI00210FB99D|nr:IclR family transcriptional regulator C-terminal domain-containing protein [Methylocapsa sp. S129]